MSTRIPVIFALLCALIMALPFAAMPFYTVSVDAEQREQSPPPRLFAEGGSLNESFSGELEAWLSDRYAGRAEMIRANALLNVAVLGTSPEESVIIGRDGMLFFRETVPDFEDTAPLTPEETGQILKNLRMLSMALEQRGTNLYIAIAPNKNTVYPEYMPAGFTFRGTDGNIGRLERIVRDAGAEWIDLLSPLRAAKSSGAAYYHTDTHWNESGAYAAAEAILNAMGREAETPVDAETIEYSGDLSRMLGLQDVLSERTEHLSAGYDGEPPKYDQHDLEAFGEGEGDLLFLRDSFGTVIAPFIVRPYERTRLIWQEPLFAAEDAEDALILISERNIRMYLMEAPLCIAPRVDFEFPEAKADCEFELYEEGGLIFAEFKLKGADAADGYVSLDGEAWWAAALSDGERENWFRAVFDPNELSPDMEIEFATEAAASSETWILGDYIDLEAEDDYDGDEDLRWLEELRSLDEEEG